MSRNHEPTPSRPVPLKTFDRERRRLSVLNHDQKIVEAFGQDRPDRRASRDRRSASSLALTPPPAYQLLTKSTIR